MTIDLDRLEALARAATPEEWDDSVSVDDEVARAHDFRAAANPAAVLELVERLRAAESQADQGAEAARQHFRDEAKLAVFEAIVRDLADNGDPISPGIAACAVCGGYQPGADAMKLTDHDPDCAYRRAVEARDAMWMLEGK